MVTFLASRILRYQFLRKIALKTAFYYFLRVSEGSFGGVFGAFSAFFSIYGVCDFACEVLWGGALVNAETLL